MGKLIKTKKEADALIGKRVRIVNPNGSHLVPIGSNVVLTGVAGNAGSSYGYRFYHDYETSGGATVLKGTNFELVPQTKNELEKELRILRANFKKQETEIKNRLAFIKETGAIEYDEMEFKAYNTLSIIEDDKTSKSEKAKLIANLINGNV